MEQELKTFIRISSPIPLILFTTEEITGCNKETAKGATKAPRNAPSCFLFCVLLFQ